MKLLCLHRKIIVFILASMIISCGSGETTKTPLVQPVDLAPATNTFSTQVIYTNACQISTPSVGAKLLIHDENFEVIEVISTDDDGVLSYETTDDTIDVSIIFGQEDNFNDNVIKAITLMDSPVTQIEPIYELMASATEGCDCQWIQPELISNHIQRPADGVSIRTFNGDIIYATQKTELGSEVRAHICKSEDGKWPSIYTTLWFSLEQELNGMVISDYQIEDLQEGEQVFISEQATELNYVVTNENTFDNIGFSLVGVFNENVYLNHNSVLTFASFPMDLYQFQASQSNSYSINNSLDVIKVTRSNTKIFTDIYSEISLTIPENSDQMIIDSLTHEDGTYDLTPFDNIDILSQYRVVQFENGYLVSWTYYGPQTGTLIGDKVLDITKVFDVDSLQVDGSFFPNPTVFDTTVFGSESIDNYTDYIKNLKLNSRYHDLGNTSDNILSISIRQYN